MELISEPIYSDNATFDTVAMARGEPGLPRSFVWRKRSYEIIAVVKKWKTSEREGGSGELYLRRHYFRLKMDDGSHWTVYFVRQAPRSGNAKSRISRISRWFLYTVEVH